MARDFDKEFTDKFTKEFDAKFNEEANNKFSKGFNKDNSKKFDKEVSDNLNKELNEEINSKLNEEFNDKFNEDFNKTLNKEFTIEFNKNFNKEFNEKFKNVIDYNIDKPNDLKDIFDSSIKKSKRKLLIKSTIKNSKIVISIFIVFIISINLFPKLSTFAINLPIIGKISEYLIIDKGLNNAIEEGLYQDINYKEAKNGITLNVTNIAGDYRSLYLEYFLEKIEKNDVRIKIRGKNNEEIAKSTSKYISSEDGSEDLNSCYQISLSKYVKDFIVTFFIYEDRNSEITLAEFNVKINLNDKFNVDVNNIEVKNTIIETEVGEIELQKLYSTTTRTSLEFKFLSSEYDYMGFENARLVDEKGEEYSTSNVYSSSNNDNLNVDFEGDLSKKKELIFKADGIYFARKDNRILTLDVENFKLEDNDYNIRLLTEEELKQFEQNQEISENIISLNSKGTFWFNIKLNDKIKRINSGRSSMGSIEEDGYKKYKSNSEAYDKLEILTNEKIIQLEIESITRDKTQAIKFKLK